MTLVLIMLGAYVRLSDAGLGCPDWPGCYGQLLGVPQSMDEAAKAFPDRPFDTGKAWREMAHRYVAAVLGLLIALMAFVAWLNRGEQRQPLLLPIVLLILVILQALLGMWTVTLLLQPMIVTTHLLGGIATMALLWWLFLKTHPRVFPPQRPTSHHGLCAALWLLPCCCCSFR